MADLSDVSTALAQIVAAAIYPNGTSQPSVTGNPVRIYEGWPQASQLDFDMAGRKLSADGTTTIETGLGPVPNVSIFPMQGATAVTFQVLNEPYVLVPPVHNLSAAIVAPTITVSGTPGLGEYVTIIADLRRIYSRNGATLTEILTALAADAAPDYPGASSTATTVTLPGAQEIMVRIGASCTMGQTTHRQKQALMVTIWAPDPATRSRLSAPIDVAIKAQLRLTLPDTSQAIITYDRVMQSDNWETVAVYRRDLIYNVEYATLETWTAYEVTSVTTNFDPIGTYEDQGTSQVSVIN